MTRSRYLWIAHMSGAYEQCTGATQGSLVCANRRISHDSSDCKQQTVFSIFRPTEKQLTTDGATMHFTTANNHTALQIVADKQKEQRQRR